MGLLFVPITLIATSGVPADDAGLASGLFNTSQQIGGALGLAVLSTIATSRALDLTPAGGQPGAAALTDGFQTAFLGGAGFAALGFVLTLLLIRGSDSRAHVALGQAVPGEEPGGEPGSEATEPASA
jgi:hypothetical protein